MKLARGETQPMDEAKLFVRARDIIVRAALPPRLFTASPFNDHRTAKERERERERGEGEAAGWTLYIIPVKYLALSSSALACSSRVPYAALS